LVGKEYTGKRIKARAFFIFILRYGVFFLDNLLTKTAFLHSASS